MTFFCGDVEKMSALGKLLGSLAQNGDVFCLSGDLGAGKTLLCREIALAQGVADDDISSPTFSIMNIYCGAMEIRHFDLYRLETLEELENIGYEEYIGGSGLTLVEWADNFWQQMPEERLDIIIKIVSGGRMVELLPQGTRYMNLCEEVEKNADFSH